MRILTLTRMVGLAAIGGAVYVHKQRGGSWTKDSVQDTLRHLLATAADKLGGTHLETRSPSERSPNVSSPMPTRSRISDEPLKSRGFGDLSKRSDDSGRH